MLKLLVLNIYLYTAHLFTNKYVLSVLEFQYPSIFQGWQTFVGVVVLLILRYSGHLQLFTSSSKITGEPSVLSITRHLTYLPSCLSFTLTIYSGSRSLAVLPISLYIVISGLSQIVEAYAYTLLSLRTSYKMTKYTIYLTVMGLLFTAVMCAQTDPQIHEHYPGYWWMAIHILSLSVHKLTRKLHCSGFYTDIEELFMNYLVSVLVLAPSSYYLGDVIEAQNYPHRYFKNFYLSCLFSGIVGVLYHLISLYSSPYPPESYFSMICLGTNFRQLISKSISIILSLFVFRFIHPFSINNYLWVFVNQILCYIYDYHGIVIIDGRGDCDAVKVGDVVIAADGLDDDAMKAKSSPEPPHFLPTFTSHGSEECGGGGKIPRSQSFPCTHLMLKL